MTGPEQFEPGASAPPGQTAARCIYVTAIGMTVTSVKALTIAINRDSNTWQLRIRFAPGLAARLAALSEKLIHKPAPHNQLAFIVAGHVITAQLVVAKFTPGNLAIGISTSAAGEHIVRQLVGP